MANLEAVSLLEAVQRDMDNDVYNYTKGGKCSQCGSCCSNYLYLTQEEIDAIHKYMKHYHIKECKHLLPLAKPHMDFTCPFLDTDKETEKCRIYAKRPSICERFSCSKSQRDLQAEKDRRKFSNGKYRLISMREEFFGGEVDDLLQMFRQW